MPKNLLHLSKHSIDLDLIQSVLWDESMSGVKTSEAGVKTNVYWNETRIYFAGSPAPSLVTLRTDLTPEYAKDVEKLKAALKRTNF